MSLIALPYIFQPGTTIASAQVNADFAAITSVVNGNLDGTNFASIFSSLNLANTGHATCPGGLIIQWGKTQNVAFDNSAAKAVTFDIPFVSSVFCIVTGIAENTLVTPAAVNAYTSGIVATGLGAGFNLTALGGQAGSTGTVYWIAVGQ